MRRVLPDADEGNAGAASPLAEPKYIDADGKLVLCIQSYLVKTPHHTILVDTCVGNHKERPTAAVLASHDERSL